MALEQFSIRTLVGYTRMDWQVRHMNRHVAKWNERAQILKSALEAMRTALSASQYRNISLVAVTRRNWIRWHHKNPTVVVKIHFLNDWRAVTLSVCQIQSCLKVFT